jgi:hypothetical protein
MSLVNDSKIEFNGTARTSSLPVSVPLSIAANDVLRLATLHAAFNEVVQHSLKSPFFDQLYAALLQHKQTLMGQSLAFPPVFAPTSTVAPFHLMRGAVPDQDVVNHSRLAATYKRSAKGRIQTATARDPTAYSLHKRGIEGQTITCDCGESLKNSKRSRYYHSRNSKTHLQWLASRDAAAEMPSLEVEQGSGNHDCSYESDAHDEAADAAADNGNPNQTIQQPAVDDVSKNAAADAAVAMHITDSLMEEINTAAPHNPALTPLQNAVRVGFAATDALAARTTTKKKRWVTIQHDDTWITRGSAWRAVQPKESDFLPNCTEQHLLDFKVNQFCDACADDVLCATHSAMKCSSHVDLTAKHFSAVKASGHCIVECGGEGDCFYHSMIFLAKMFRKDLHEKWGSHDKLRRDTCNKLMV